MFCKNQNVFVNRSDFSVIRRAISLPPSDIDNKIPPPKNLVHHHLQIVGLVVVDGDPNGAVLGQQFPQQFQPRVEQTQPGGMLQIVVVLFKSAAGVVGGSM